MGLYLRKAGIALGLHGGLRCRLAQQTVAIGHARAPDAKIKSQKAHMAGRHGRLGLETEILHASHDRL